MRYINHLRNQLKLLSRPSPQSKLGSTHTSNPNMLGSFFTPSCADGVVWNIIGRVRSISREQVKELKAPLIYRCKRNARPAQPLNERKIEMYDDVIWQMSVIAHSRHAPTSVAPLLPCYGARLRFDILVFLIKEDHKLKAEPVSSFYPAKQLTMKENSCHVAFFPFTAYGHMIPMIDMAVLFASRGVQATIITTRETTHLFTKSIQKTMNYTYQITLHVIENSDKPVPGQHVTSFFDVISMLQEPFEQFIQQARPDCVVADMFYPWTTKIAAKYNIPRIVFNGTGFFPLCVVEAMRLYDPARDVSSDSEPFIVPHLPHKIMSTKKQLARIEEINIEGFVKVFTQAGEAEATSYGVVINSFYELEPEYARHYREVMKRKAWHIGPVSLCSKNKEDKLERGEKSGINVQECLKWLDSKAHDSVVYVSFGTMVTVTCSQLYEIAMGLEACDNDFIWVIKNEEEKSFPEGFKMRMKEKGKGLIIKGWAPQVLILDHGSVGGFVTHCGWNSVLEGVSGGVAMVAWPVMAEQFFNAKLVTDVLRIGVSIGDVDWSATSKCEGVKRETIANAVARLMGTEGGQEMRRRAQVLKEKAKTAVEEDGSSYSDLSTLLREIKAFKPEL